MGHQDEGDQVTGDWEVGLYWLYFCSTPFQIHDQSARMKNQSPHRNHSLLYYKIWRWLSLHEHWQWWMVYICLLWGRLKDTTYSWTFHVLIHNRVLLKVLRNIWKVHLTNVHIIMFPGSPDERKKKKKKLHVAICSGHLVRNHMKHLITRLQVLN